LPAIGKKLLQREYDLGKEAVNGCRYSVFFYLQAFNVDLLCAQTRFFGFNESLCFGYFAEEFAGYLYRPFLPAVPFAGYLVKIILAIYSA
jgi:hypothetical protein